jgi:hypothetical protein
MKLELLIILSILLLSGLFILLYKYSDKPQPVFIYTSDQPKNTSNISKDTKYYPPNYSGDKVMRYQGVYQQYQPYFPQSLGISGNTFVDYVNSKYNGYYPGYNYTFDPYFYNWNGYDNRPENVKKSINIENKPYISINTSIPKQPKEYPQQHPQESSILQQHPQEYPQQHPQQYPQESSILQQHPQEYPQQHPQESSILQQHPQEYPQESSILQQHPQEYPQEYPSATLSP